MGRLLALFLRLFPTATVDRALEHLRNEPLDDENEDEWDDEESSDSSESSELSSVTTPNRLIPPGFPLDYDLDEEDNRDVAADWWEDHGEDAKAEELRRWDEDTSTSTLTSSSSTSTSSLSSTSSSSTPSSSSSSSSSSSESSEA